MQAKEANKFILPKGRETWLSMIASLQRNGLDRFEAVGGAGGCKQRSGGKQNVGQSQSQHPSSPRLRLINFTNAN